MLPQPLWFYGTIENVDDEKQAGKVQVRIHGVHDHRKASLPTKFLPWAQVMVPAVSTSKEGVGRTPTGLTVGTEIMGIALDDAYTDLKVLFTWQGIEDQEHGRENDVTPIARGGSIPAMDEKKNKVNKSTGGGTTWTEPFQDYSNTKYPDNDVTITRAGHIIEFDNTSGNERIHLFHKNGSYMEMQTAGDVVFRASRDRYNVVLRDDCTHIHQHERKVVQGSSTTHIKATYYASYDKGWTLSGIDGALWIDTKEVEIVTPVIRMICDAWISGKLTVPTIHCTTAYIDNLHTKNATIDKESVGDSTIQKLDAVAPQAKEAMVAMGIKIPVTPLVFVGGGATAAGDTSSKQQRTDNKGEIK